MPSQLPSALGASPASHPGAESRGPGALSQDASLQATINRVGRHSIPPLVSALPVAHFPGLGSQGRAQDCSWAARKARTCLTCGLASSARCVSAAAAARPVHLFTQTVSSSQSPEDRAGHRTSAQDLFAE